MILVIVFLIRLHYNWKTSLQATEYISDSAPLQVLIPNAIILGENVGDNQGILIESIGKFWKQTKNMTKKVKLLQWEGATYSNKLSYLV